MYEVPVNQPELWVDFLILNTQEDGKNEIQTGDWAPSTDPEYAGFYFTDVPHNVGDTLNSSEMVFHLKDFGSGAPVDVHEILPQTENVVRLIADGTPHLMMITHAVVPHIRPISGLTKADFVCMYKKYGDTAFSTLTLDVNNFRETGSGWYQIRFENTHLDTPGQFLATLTSKPSASVQFMSTEMLRLVPQETSPTGQIVNITIEDQDSDPVDGAEIAIYDVTNTNYLFRQVSDFSGNAQFYLPPGEYRVRVMKPLFDFNNPEILLVPAGGTDETFTGTSFIVTLPEIPGTCTLYGRILDADGNPKANTTVTAQSTKRGSNAILDENGVATTTLSVQTDEDGRFELGLMIGLTVRLIIEAMEIDIKRVVPDQQTISLPDFSSV